LKRPSQAGRQQVIAYFGLLAALPKSYAHKQLYGRSLDRLKSCQFVPSNYIKAMKPAEPAAIAPAFRLMTAIPERGDTGTLFVNVVSTTPLCGTR
jgi:hypothetical protein